MIKFLKSLFSKPEVVEVTEKVAPVIQQEVVKEQPKPKKQNPRPRKPRAQGQGQKPKQHKKPKQPKQ